MTSHVLFLCTGNYYRSRYAEALFTDRAERRALAWTASSRGLWQGWSRNRGPLSKHTKAALAAQRVAYREAERPPLQVSMAEVLEADRVIAMYEREHRPMVEARFVGAARLVEYWQVPDIYDVEPAVALAQIDRDVDALVAELARLG